MIQERLHLGSVLLCWLVVAAKAWSWGVLPRSPGLRANLVALLFGAVFVTLTHPGAYGAVDLLTGVPNLARLLADAAAVLAFFGMHRRIDQYEREGGGQDRLAIIGASLSLLVGTLAAMAVCWTLSPLDASTPRDLMLRYGAAPFVLEYQLAFIQYVALGLVRLLRFAHRIAGQAPESDRMLVFRLRYYAWSSVLSLGYCAHLVLQPLLSRAGLTYPRPGPDVVGGVLLAFSAVTTMAGDAMFDVLDWFCARRTEERIAYLRERLAVAFPGLTLPAELAPISREERLEGQVLEVADALLQLRWYNDSRNLMLAREACRASRRRGDTASLVVAAAELACALDAGCGGRRLREPYPLQALPPDTPYPLAVRRLAVIAEVLRTSPLVAASLVLRRELDGGEPTVQAAARRRWCVRGTLRGGVRLAHTRPGGERAPSRWWWRPPSGAGRRAVRIAGSTGLAQLRVPWRPPTDGG